MCCAMEMKVEPVNLICHGLELYRNASVSYCTLKLTLARGSNTMTGVTVTVNDTVSYEVGETDGVVNITLIFDQPSCQPIIIVANPRVRSIPDATGNNSCLTNVSLSMRS